MTSVLAENLSMTLDEEAFVLDFPHPQPPNPGPQLYLLHLYLFRPDSQSKAKLGSQYEHMLKLHVCG